MRTYEMYLPWPVSARCVIEVRPAENNISETFIQYFVDDVCVCRDDFLALLALQRTGKQTP